MTNPDNYTTLFDHNQIGISLEEDLGLTIAQKQKFTIQEISPEWAYASETTKVLVRELNFAFTFKHGHSSILPMNITEQ